MWEQPRGLALSDHPERDTGGCGRSKGQSRSQDTDGTRALHGGCCIAGSTDSPVHRGRCLVFMSYLRHSLWKFSFFSRLKLIK